MKTVIRTLTQRSATVLISLFIGSVAIASTSSPATDTELHQFGKTKNFPVYVSRGEDTVAKAAADLSTSAYDSLSQLLGVKPQVTLLVLNERDWAKYSSQVYGMPSFEDGNLIVATSSGPFWEGFTDLIRKMNPADLPNLLAVYANDKGEIDLSSFFNLLVLHEMGHAFHIEAGRTDFPRPWMLEFYANLALQVVIAENAQALQNVLLTFPTSLQKLPRSAFPHTALAEFDVPSDETGFTPENYVWYQTKLHVAAKSVYDATKSDDLKFLLQAKYPKSRMTDAELSIFFTSQGHQELSDIVDRWDP